MKASRLKMVVIILIVLVLIALGVAVGARRWPPSTTTQERGQLKATDTLPPVTSHIKGIEVVSAFVDADGLLNITVVNKTGKAIVGIGISSGTMTYTDDNGLTEDNPKPLIVPNGNYTLMPSVSNFQTN